MAKQLLAVAQGHLDDDNYAEALRTGKKALEAFEKDIDMPGIGDAACVIASAYCGCQERRVAHEFISEKVNFFKDKADWKEFYAKMLWCKAEVNYDKRGSKYRKVAKKSALEALDIFRKISDEKMEAKTLLTLGNILGKECASGNCKDESDDEDVKGSKPQPPKDDMKRRALNKDKALSCAKGARELFKKLGEKKQEALAAHNMAVAYTMSSRWTDALEAAEDALNLFREVGDKKLEAFEMQCIAAWDNQVPDRQSKLQRAAEALEVARKIPDGHSLEASAFSVLAKISRTLEKSDAEPAKNIGKEIARRLRNVEDMESLGQVYQAMVRVCERDDAWEAINYARKCIQMVEATEDHSTMCTMKQKLAELYTRCHRPDLALEVAKEALKGADKSLKHDIRATVSCRFTLARIFLAAKKGTEALRYANAALHQAIKATFKKIKIDEEIPDEMRLATRYEWTRHVEQASTHVLSTDIVKLAHGYKVKDEVGTWLLEQDTKNLTHQLLRHRANWHYGRAEAHSLVARAKILLGEHDEAAPMLLKAKECLDEVGDIWNANKTSIEVATLYYRLAEEMAIKAKNDADFSPATLEGIQRRTVEAENLAKEALERARQCGFTLDEICGLMLLATIGKWRLKQQQMFDPTFLIAGDASYEHTLVMLQQAIKLARRARHQKLIAKGQTLLADLLLMNNDAEGSLGASIEASRITKFWNLAHEEAEVLPVLAEGHFVLKENAEAWAAANAALSKYRNIYDPEKLESVQNLLDLIAVQQRGSTETKVALAATAEVEKPDALEDQPKQGQKAPQQLVIGERPPVDPVSANEELVVVRIKLILEKDLQLDLEDIDLDTPLMQAGLTSNSATFFQHACSESFPTVKLPPTMAFDYPSVTDVSRFILENIKQS